MGINKNNSEYKAFDYLNKRIDNREFDLPETENHIPPYPINLTEKQNSKSGELVEKCVRISLLMLLTITALQAQDQDREAVTSTLDALHLYAHEADGKKYFSLYTDDAVINGNTVDAIIGKEAIKSDLIKWFENADSIDHKATVISANVLNIPYLCNR